MRVLVLGGIRSGKSELAEELVAGAGRVRYIATSADPGDDPAWSERLNAHRARRPASWTTEEAVADLAMLLRGAFSDDVLLVDDLGGWLNGTFKDWSDPSSVSADVDDLLAAVVACPARLLVLVSVEVGLTVMPATESGRTFADANGTLNRKIAAECEAVALVVAGQTAWLKGSFSGGTAGAPVVKDTPFIVDGVAAGIAAAIGADVGTDMPGLDPGLELPVPDDVVAAEAVTRLLTLDFPGAGLGELVPIVRFAAGAQGRPDPRPWTSPRVLLLSGEHEGAFGAGDLASEAARRVAEARAGTGPVALLAAAVGASVRTVDCPRSAAAETDDALDPETVDAALRLGWQLAADAADEGVDLLILAVASVGATAAAAGVVAVTTGGEPAGLLGRVVGADGFVDDDAWIRRCVAIRDTRHRIRARGRDPRTLLSMLAGGDIAVATGVILGAAARRTPVLIDGPVGVAAGLVARDFGAQTRHWLLLPDTGNDPTVKLGGDVLGTTPITSLRLSLGEGTTALATLPLFNTALTMAAATPVRPDPSTPAGSTEASFLEPAEFPEPVTTGTSGDVEDYLPAADGPGTSGDVPAGEGLDMDAVNAEIQRVVTDSPTAELPVVPGEPEEPAPGA